MAKPRRELNPPAEARMADGGGRLPRAAPPRVGQDDLEQVQREIDAFKAEAIRESVVETHASIEFPKDRGPAFACSAIDERAYADLCICDDKETPPWARCPQHDGTVD